MAPFEVYLGQKVKTSLNVNDATVWIVKRIDSDEEQAFIVSLDGKHRGWVSFVGLFFVKGN